MQLLKFGLGPRRSEAAPRLRIPQSSITAGILAVAWTMPSPVTSSQAIEYQHISLGDEFHCGFLGATCIIPSSDNRVVCSEVRHGARSPVDQVPMK